MKKFLTTLIFLALIATTSIFVSCSSDDNNNSVQIQQDPLLGRWIAEKVAVKVTVDGNVMQDETGDITNELDLYFEFKEGNVVTLYQKQFSTGQVNEGTGTYTISGSTMTINISGEPQNFTYALENGELTLKLNEKGEIEGQNYIVEITYFLYK
ncbi:hypothetical protein [Flavobacterium sp. I3-2]|uniref:hypothetical protein n=1 Tax=Flavobacterium sp. I3-2 TaxID=2748319 RepID=UPI0015AA13D1|nr:hypothetical protein [Flavobacterium sp. I3-2]